MNSKMLPEIQLKKGQQRRVRAGHPWVFSNELDMTPEAKALTPGAIVRFVDAGAELMGTGFFNPHSLIAGRIVSRGGAMIDGGGHCFRLTCDGAVTTENSKRWMAYGDSVPATAINIAMTADLPLETTLRLEAV